MVRDAGATVKDLFMGFGIVGVDHEVCTQSISTHEEQPMVHGVSASETASANGEKVTKGGIIVPIGR